MPKEFQGVCGMKLKDVFNLAKYSYYHKSGNTYVIEKNNEYYCRVKTESDAKKVTYYLKRNGFSKDNLEKALSETGVERCKKGDKISNTGFYKVSKQKNARYKLGYMYTYEYKKNDKHSYLKATTLEKLRKKVIGKGYEWRPITDEAKNIEEKMIE